LKHLDALEKLEQAEGVMRRLGQGLGGDPVWDRSRILRAPGTFNHKYDAPRLVELERFEPRLRYDLDQLEEMAQAFPEEVRPRVYPRVYPPLGVVVPAATPSQPPYEKANGT
jgi:hypothetical protein